MNQYDVIIIGGGHAGTEAALVSARMGVATLLLTHNIETLGQMSCNPAIGGIGKTHLVKEIDALGGVMAQASDHAGIQFRILNQRKGPAVQATRAQTDRLLYKSYVRSQLEQQDRLWIMQEGVENWLIDKGRIRGVITQQGLTLYAQCVVLCAGTFLGGVLHMGKQTCLGGRAGDGASSALAQKLKAFGFRVNRLKTGTPARLDGRTIDYSSLTKQPSDNPCPVMSYLGHVRQHPKQICCYVTYTNNSTHQIIRDNLQSSPMFSGYIEGVGPRYCPSIEDKIVRFATRERHPIFLEPEGLSTSEVYPNGISTSLPYDIQERFIRSIKGLEHCHITRAGYAIEYDFFDPRDLKSSLETKKIRGLYFAGQINGTTGYEEAAAQGLIAGLNAALAVQGEKPFSLGRDQAYIGVLIDDLITKGTQEPYRMFTSRAEYRLALRQDNADLRLTEIGYKLGCVGQERWQAFCKRREQIEKEKSRLRHLWLIPGTDRARDFSDRFNQTLEHETHAFDLLKRSEVSYAQLMPIIDPDNTHLDMPFDVAFQVEVQSHYEGYLMRQTAQIAREKKHQLMPIPSGINYTEISGLSHEVRQRLMAVQPETIGQASRISGVTPAAIALLLIYLKKCQRAA